LAKRNESLTIRSLSEDKQFCKIFSTYKECEKNGVVINPFKDFNPNKKELYMPPKMLDSSEKKESEPPSPKKDLNARFNQKRHELLMKIQV
jgi:hypothetical protein